MAYFEMAKTVLKSVLHGPATIRYPAQPAKITPISRGHVTIDPSTCISCGMYMRKFPVGARSCVTREEKKWEPMLCAANSTTRRIALSVRSV